MGEFRQSTTIFLSTFAVSVLGLSLAAQAQMSPFAKKGKQAWETSDPTPVPTTSPTTTAPQQSYQYQYPAAQPQTLSGAYQPSGGLAAPVQTAQKPNYPSNYNYAPAQQAQAPIGQSAVAQPDVQTHVKTQAPSQMAAAQPGATYDYPSYGNRPAAQPALRGTPSQANGSYYPGRANPYGVQQQAQSRSPFAPPSQTQPYPAQQTQQTQQPRPQNPYGTPVNQPRSWSDKLGLGNVEFNYEGYVKAGAAGTHRDSLTTNNNWGEDFILDGSLRGEVSAITRGGLEYGAVVEVRGQYDQYRRGFGGRAGDCPPGIAGCASTNVGGTDFGLRGHTSRFYASGANDAKDIEAQVESAHLFLRSAYGDVTIGRDDGSAYLFSLGAPTLLNVGASNNAVDYTGLDAVKTINDASGFSEKITYTSPRLLGDSIGVGVQFGASYALDAQACGVDYCVRGNDKEPTGILAPDIEDVMEFGVALDRKFDNGLSVEATANYARGSEKSAIAAFDDLKSLGLALELGYLDWTLGGSYLHSNNGLASGDYEAMDVGLTWKPNKLGFTLGYGHATDDNIGLTSDQAIFGLSYDVRENMRIGTGVQYVNRDVNVYDVTSGLISGQNEDATSVFVEGRFTF